MSDQIEWQEHLGAHGIPEAAWIESAPSRRYFRTITSRRLSLARKNFTDSNL